MLGGTRHHLEEPFIVTTSAAASADAALVQGVVREVAKRIVGQEYMVERLLISLLTGGHVLLEGVPGLAKTLTVRTLAEKARAADLRGPTIVIVGSVVSLRDKLEKFYRRDVESRLD